MFARACPDAARDAQPRSARCVASFESGEIRWVEAELETCIESFRILPTSQTVNKFKFWVLHSTHSRAQGLACNLGLVWL